MSCDGGNDYKQAHDGGRIYKKNTPSPFDFVVNLDGYDRCVR